MQESDSETIYAKARTNNLLILAWLVLLLGLVSTSFVGYQAKIDLERYEHQQFEAHCKEIQVRIQAQLAKHRLMLLGGAALFDVSQYVSREEWRNYVKRLSLSRDLDGVQAFGFSLWIKPEQLNAHEERLRKEGFPDYHVKPAGKRDAYTSVIYIEPFSDRNLRAFGYDMYSEPIRHAAMNQAVDNNNVSLSGKVILLQEDTTAVQAGTLMYAPVYQKNKPLDTVEQRRGAIFGWVYSPFRMTDLLHNIVLDSGEVDDSNVRLRVYDGDKIQDENLLYQSESAFSEASPLFSLETQIELYAALWTLHFEQFITAKGNLDYSKVWIIMSAGMFISFLLFFLLRSYFLMQKNAHRIALELTQQLHEKEKKLALANADLVQFTNIAAHHLQEPIRRIVSFVQRLKIVLTNTQNFNDDAIISLQFIEQSAVRQRALVSDIQLYLAATQPRAAIESVSVVDILTKVLKHHALLIQKTKAQIEYGELPSVIMDYPRLYDIFNILIDNALNYQRLDTPPKIRIYGKNYAQQIRYYVEDNGTGIPAEYRERVFLVFERLQVNENQESTGIGLAIVRRILESCGGSVSLQETAGGGTTVVLNLRNGS